MFTRKPSLRLEKFAMTCTKRLLQQNLPTADSCTAANERAWISLFDYLVGAEQDRSWNVDADGLRSLQVDDELELGRLLDR
jgi:hypothetical protein